MALTLYAEAFEAASALSHLPDFLARHGARFYGLPPSEERLVLERAPGTVPASVVVPGAEEVVPLRAGEALSWRLGGGGEDGYSRTG